jgi:hypothetical protein
MIHVNIMLGSSHSMADATLSDLLPIFHIKHKISHTDRITTEINYIFDTSKYKIPFNFTWYNVHSNRFSN